MLIMLRLMLVLVNLGRIRHIDVCRVRHELRFLGVHDVFLGPDGGGLVGAAVGDAAEVFGVHAGAQRREGEEGEDEFHVVDFWVWTGSLVTSDVKIEL